MNSKCWDSNRLVLQHLLRDIRKEVGLTQSELANILGKPQSFVSKYESGERRLDLIEVRSVCLKCDISLSELIIRLESLLPKEVVF